ncbi:hypothetical protein BGZ76_002636, partial [Entomortierella beljakovae]
PQPTDKTLNVRKAVARALRNQSILSDSTTTALFKAPGNETREAVTDTSVFQSTLSDATIAKLVADLQGKRPYARVSAVIELGKESTLSDSATAALVAALRDEYSNVRNAAAKALGNQSTFSDSTTVALSTALQDKEFNVRYSVANAFSKQSSLSESTVALISTSLCVNFGWKRDLIRLLGSWRIYLSLKDLTADEIENLYRRGLFEYSCKNYASLFIHNNRLQIYTEQGFQAVG